METTSVIALSRQAALRRQMDVVANNIANVDTSGFKGERMMFVEHLVKSKGGESLIAPKLAYVRDIATMTDLSEGPFETTGNPLDVAISGDGYFAIQTQQGEAYTRSGRFRLDEQGQLVNHQGHPVLSQGGAPVIFAPTDKKIEIARDGTISTENGELGKLRLVRFDNPQALKRTAGALFSAEANNPPLESTKAALVQGALESSNVEGIVEMANMINLHRTYDSVRTFINKEDERQRSMIKALGGGGA